MSLQIVTPPYAAPMSLVEAKLSLKQDVTDDDALITGFLSAARASAEFQTRHILVATKFRQWLDAFPVDGCITLENRPVIEVSAVEYVDADGVTQTIDDADYRVILRDDVTRIEPAYGVDWPTTRDQADAVSVTFIAGHAAPLTADATANMITVRGWKALEVGDIIRVSNSGGALPAPLAVDTDYYVLTAPGAGVYTLSLTAGGAAIDLTTAGTGTSYLGTVPEGIKNWMCMRMGGLDGLRSETSALKLERVPFFDGLLDPYRAYF